MVADGVVWLCGETTENNISRVVELLKDGAGKKLVIDTFGGDTRQAMKLGRFLRAEKIDLYVNNVCLSSCAQILLPAANNLFFRNNSLIGMHDSQFSTNLLTGYSSEASSQEAQMETEYYEEFDVSLDILTFAHERLGTVCMINYDEFISSGSLRVRSHFDFYMPSRREFESLIQRKVPNYPNRELAKSFFSRSRLGETFEFNFETTVPAELEGTPRC